MGAGGLWMPYKCDDPRIDKWSIDTLDELLTLSKSAMDINKNSNSDNKPPVEIVPTVYLTSSHRGPSIDDFVKSDYENKSHNKIITPLPDWTKDPRISFQHLTIEMLSWQNHVMNLRIPSEKELLDAKYTHAWLFHPPIVDPPRMLMVSEDFKLVSYLSILFIILYRTELCDTFFSLKGMLKEIQSHYLMQEDSKIDMNTKYASLEEMVNDAKDLGCDVVANCTGLGAARLCDDSSMIGGRGVLLHYDRSCSRREYSGEGLDRKHDACVLTEEGNWGSRNEPCYLIIRGDVLVVGGSYNEGDGEVTLRNKEKKRLEQNAWKLGIDTENTKSKAEWVGWRPCRPNVCVKSDNSIDPSIRIVHSYGVGGSGWTVFTGIAKETVKLLLNKG